VTKKTEPIRFAGSELGEHRHACAFFNSDFEADRVLLPFISDGFACGDKAIHVINPGQCCNHLQKLASAGIDTAAAKQAGQLEVRINTEAYLRDGQFDQDRMLEVFGQLAEAKSDFRLSRIVCQMDWAADRSHINDLIEFEARVNHLWARHEDAVICVYDLAKFGGDTVIDIMRTHPMIVIGGILQQNPFFVTPEQFLRERRAQQAVK
jgi:hypothetical protein